jgi:hypothetical protein
MKPQHIAVDAADGVVISGSYQNKIKSAVL